MAGGGAGSGQVNTDVQSTAATGAVGFGDVQQRTGAKVFYNQGAKSSKQLLIFAAVILVVAFLYFRRKK